MSPLESVDRQLRETIELHFDEERGAPFWIERTDELSFDPTMDVEEPADLIHFAEDDAYGRFPIDRLRTEPRSLIPQRYSPSEYGFYSTGGRTGRPKWTAWVDDGLASRMEETMEREFDDRSVPPGRDVLYVGPTGPHVVGEMMRRLARCRDGSFLTIDLDPRWIRKAKTDPELRELGIDEEYRNHIREQLIDLLTTHGSSVGTLVSTPTLIEGMYEAGALGTLDLDAIVFSGQAIEPANYRLFEDELDAVVFGAYGNTLVGAEPQVGYDEDHEAIVYQPGEDHVIYEVVDPDTIEESGPLAGVETVEYGDRGRLIAHVIREGLFAPYLLEDDSAIRLRPRRESDNDALGNPDVATAIREEIEAGVY